jgi:hypothetical protein
LGDAYADGRLSLQEHSERIDRVWASKTIGELEPLIADLGRAKTPAATAKSRSSVTNLPVVGSSSSNQIRTIMSSAKRQGEWYIGPNLNLFGIMGKTELDMREAIFTSITVEFNISMMMGSLEILIPAGVGFDDQTVKLVGSTKLEGITEHDPNAPIITLKGFCLFAQIKIIGPEYKTLKEKLAFWK